MKNLLVAAAVSLVFAAFFAAFLLLPLLVILIAYWVMVWQAKRRSRKAKAANAGATQV
jgi:cbb3-type cytochrome oxidase subunit 3